MQLCFFDDKNASNFLPLTLTRPTDDLRLGILTIREKWEQWLKPKQITRLTKPHLEAVFPTPTIENSTSSIWINSRCIPSKTTVDAIRKLETGEALIFNGLLIACKIDGVKSFNYLEDRMVPSSDSTLELNQVPTLITYYWDLLALNGSQIEQDIKLLRANAINPLFADANISLVNPENIFISDTATIEPGVKILAQNGPVFIGKNAIIEAGSILRGPVAICNYAQVKANARISSGTTIGPVCKAGGEISNCIFHSYSNKSHDDFAGNSIFGQWCNLAAGTITSNLKSNYGYFTVPHWETGEQSTRSVQFFGTVFGDFSKTAIQTKLNVGTICGVNSNILTSAFSPKKIQSFTWLSDAGATSYDFEKALISMKAMMARRDIELTNEYSKMMEFIFKSSVTS